MDPVVISQYEHQAGWRLRPAIAGLSQQELNWKPTDPKLGLWSIQQIVLHLMDSDLIWTDRAKRVIAEDNPSLIGYNETKFANHLHYELWSADDAITIFELNRKNFANVLRHLPHAAFARVGTHNEAGVMRLGQMIQRISGHVDHHMKFVDLKRAAFGKATAQ